MRILQGLVSVDEFVAFLGGSDMTVMLPTTLGGGLAMAFLGGLALNLTPCVLPMVPVNVMIIGRSFVRGLLYAAGMALAYGVLGCVAALGGVAFGTIQGNPWFNAAVACVFVALALALGGRFILDFSHGRSRFVRVRGEGNGVSAWWAFPMGVVSAVLAGACVAPVLVAVLLLTADLYGKGVRLALALPLAVGLGLAAPWPFLAAGLRVLPRPGGWMKWVNRIFCVCAGVAALGYGSLAVRGWMGSATAASADAVRLATPETFAAVLAATPRPVLVDCGASWCKNCAAMEAVLAEPKAREALRGWSIIRLQAEQMAALRKIPGFDSIRGLPALVVIE